MLSITHDWMRIKRICEKIEIDRVADNYNFVL